LKEVSVLYEAKTKKNVISLPRLSLMG